MSSSAVNAAVQVMLIECCLLLNGATSCVFGFASQPLSNLGLLPHLVSLFGRIFCGLQFADAGHMRKQMWVRAAKFIRQRDGDGECRVRSVGQGV
jgi:uncharacterized membrane protein YdfJ with MMPL/SSD domain